MIYNYENKADIFSDMYQTLKQLDFIYENKEHLLLPFFKYIEQNWNRLLEKDCSLIHITNLSQHPDKLATCCSWRSSTNNWCIQHGIANQMRLFLFVINSECNWLKTQISAKYIQCWFQTHRSIINKICDLVKVEENMGSYHVEILDYLSWIPKEKDIDNKWHVRPYTLNDKESLKNFIVQQKGVLFYESEEFETDPFFNMIDHHYQKIDLNRSRDIYMIYKENLLKAVVLKYKGPLGINFSFLENRIEIIVDTNSKIEDDLVYSIGNIIHGMRLDLYFSPIVINHNFSIFFECNGAQILRQYSRYILTKSALQTWLLSMKKKYSLCDLNNERYE